MKGYLIILINLFFYSYSFLVTKQFNSTSKQLIDYLIKDNGKNIGYKWLEVLVDDFGCRHLGSQSLEDAIDFTIKQLKIDGFDNVHTENVDNLPHWVRGDDEVIMLEPRKLKLNILSIDGVKSSNVTAPLIVLKNLEDLNNFNVSEKIVLFTEEWNGYGKSVKYRKAGLIVEKRGAVGLIVQSITPFSLYTPHTGSGALGSNIPSVSITLEEAKLLNRLYQRKKKIIIQMNIKSNVLNSTITSRNTIFEIKGSKWPEEIILLSGHMDSWDVGQGALDDGGGMAAVWQAMSAILNLSKLNELFRPKRTIRGVFWTAEEQGLLGAQAYYNAHNSSNEKFFFVSETDQGAFKPKTIKSQLKFSGSDKQKKRIKEIVSLLNDYNIPLIVKSNKDQGDVVFWSKDGVPAVNYVAEKGIDYYFFYHHTQADYLSIFEEGDIDYTAAIFGVLAHILANMDSWN